MRSDLYQKEESKKFNEDRYKHGYMDEWPNSKKQRVFEVVRKLDLPEHGKALDFGCGNGVFTEVLRQALPKWENYGSDISKTAIENAVKRFPECSFFISDSDRSYGAKFDFLFSHHVLEHVYDIEKTISQMAELLNSKSSLLLVFPCGNKGSF